MKPSSAKAKGREFQKAIRDLIIAAFPTLNEDDVRSNPMGAPGEDILLSKEARKLLGGIQIECKNCKKVAIPSWLEQAEEHGKHIPVVFFKVGRGQQYAVVLKADSFLKLVGGLTSEN